MNGMTESFELVNDLLAVRFNNASPLELLKKCNAWYAKFNDETIRMHYMGNRMLESQLDLYDKARHRVYGVRFNCIREINSAAR